MLLCFCKLRGGGENPLESSKLRGGGGGSKFAGG
ncbi:hypothetical protein LINPERPRIM_LOCUS37854 [Linum perenne]